MRANENPISMTIRSSIRGGDPGRNVRQKTKGEAKKKKKKEKNSRLASLISDPRGELVGTTDDPAGKLGVGALLIDRNV